MGETMEVNEKGLDLIGLLVQQNVDDLAWTTDRIIEGKDRDILTLARELVKVATILDEALVIDRKTEARLSHVNFWRAEHILERHNSTI